MIKNKEVAMVHAADFALEYLTKNHNADAEEIIKKFLKSSESFDVDRKMKIYSVAAISEILKIKRLNKEKLKKQLMQIFSGNIPYLISRIDEDKEN